MKTSACPCNPHNKFGDCCEPLIKGKIAAVSPEALMRSRYSAYAMKNMDYIFSSTDPQTRNDIDPKATQEWMDSAKFTRLEIIGSSQEANKGRVEFKAYYSIGKDPEQTHHEISKFRRHQGAWFFREGKLIPEPDRP